MFAVGDRVAHPNHGAGIIEMIVCQNAGGRKEDFYVFKMLVGSMTVLIPAESAEKIGIRPIIRREEADRLLDFIKILEVGHDDNWNRRCRENMERLKSGDMSEVAYVVKSLNKRGREKSLSTGERKIFRSANAIFTSEIAMAKDITYESAEKLLETALESAG
jgi:CarD family transcriptional regulator